jgi:hypothetical protein
MWERLWANAFLLKKPQYFQTTSYEARWATPLKGEWDLRNGLVRVRVPEADASLALDVAANRLVRLKPIEASEDAVIINTLVDPAVGTGSDFWLVRHTPHWMTAEFGAGWNAEESASGLRGRWRWSFADRAELEVENPQASALTARLVLDARSFGERVVDAAIDDAPAGARGIVGIERKRTMLDGLVVPPGKHRLRLEIGPTTAAQPADSRSLGICVWRITVAVQEK